MKDHLIILIVNYGMITSSIEIILGHTLARSVIQQFNYRTLFSISFQS